MKRLMVAAVTSVALLGCGAASQYKFTCTETECDIETSGPAALDLRQEFGKTVEVIETADGRTTIQVGSQRKTFALGDTATVDSLEVDVVNIKGEQAFFTVRRG